MRLEEFDGKKGERKFDGKKGDEEEKSWKPLKKSSSCNLSCGHHHIIIIIIIIIIIFNHCIKNFFKRRVPRGPVMTCYSLCKLFILYLYLYLLKS